MAQQGGGPTQLTINNCSGSALRVFVRAAKAMPGNATGGEDYVELLLPTVATGTGAPITLTGLAGTGPTGVATAWVRARSIPTQTSRGTTFPAQVAECDGGSVSMPSFTAAERANLAGRVLAEALTAVIGSPAGADCITGLDLSFARLRNLSPFTPYRAVFHSKYACAPPRADFTQPVDSCGQPNESTEDAYSREDLAAESCRETFVKDSAQVMPEGCPPPQEGCFPDCCDVADRATVHCAGFVMTEAQTDGVSFKRLSPPVWSDFAMDIDVRSEQNTTPEGTKIICEDFGSHDFIFHVDSRACASEPVDADNDGVFDPCDRLRQSRDSVSGQRRAVLQRRTRNVCYDGSVATMPFPGCPAMGTAVTIGGDAALDVVNGDLLQFDLPNQDESSAVAPSEGLLVVTLPGSSSPNATEKVDSMRLAYVGTWQSGGEGIIVPVRSRTELVPAQGQAGDYVAVRSDLAATAPRIAAGQVFGIDAGAQRQRLVVNREGGAEVFNTATGLRLGNDLTHASGRLGRGVALEDEVNGGFASFAYALVTNPGRLRIIDLDDPAPTGFEEVAGYTYLPNNLVNPIIGDPVDIEILPVGGDVMAYITSVKEYGGEGLLGGGEGGGEQTQGGIEPDPGEGGGGSCQGRKTWLNVLRVDRPNEFQSMEKVQQVLLSCVGDTPELPPMEEIGLALTQARDRLVVTVPDLGGIKILPRNPDGSLDTQAVEFVPTGLRPTDVAITRTTLDAVTAERALVTSRGEAGVENGGLWVIDIENGNLVGRAFEFEAAAEPLSVSAHPDLTGGLDPVAIVADPGVQEIRAVRLVPFDPQFIRTLRTTTIPTRVTVQGQ